MSSTKTIHGYSLHRKLSKEELKAVSSLLKSISQDELSSKELISQVYNLSEYYGVVLELDASIRTIATSAYGRLQPIAGSTLD